MPNSSEPSLNTPLPKLEKYTHATSVTSATSQFCALPNVDEPEPPAM